MASAPGSTQQVGECRESAVAVFAYYCETIPAHRLAPRVHVVTTKSSRALGLAETRDEGDVDIKRLVAHEVGWTGLGTGVPARAVPVLLGRSRRRSQEFFVLFATKALMPSAVMALEA